jgi:hypothetical protein
MAQPHHVYVFDRTYLDAIIAIGKLLAPILSHDEIQDLIDRETGRVLVLSATAESATFTSYDSDQDVLEFVRAALEADTGLSIDWRVSPALQASLQTVLSDHVRRSTTDVVSNSQQ